MLQNYLMHRTVAHNNIISTQVKKMWVMPRFKNPESYTIPGTFYVNITARNGLCIFPLRQTTVV